MCHYGDRAVFWLCTICNYFLLFSSSHFICVFDLSYGVPNSITVSSSRSVLLQFISQFYNPSLLPPTHHQFWLIHASYDRSPICHHTTRMSWSSTRKSTEVDRLTDILDSQGHNVSRGPGKLGNHYRPSADLYSLLFAAKRHTLPIGWRLAKFITN